MTFIVARVLNGIADGIREGKLPDDPVAAGVIVVGSALATGWMLKKVYNTLYYNQITSGVDSPLSGDPTATLYVHGPLEVQGLASSLSPFVAKLELFLRMAEIPYERRPGTPATSPKGMVPYIVHGSTVMADTQLIIPYLQKTFPDAAMKLPTPKSPLLPGVEIALQRMVEDHLYPGLMYFRWINQQGWQSLRSTIFGGPLAAIPAMLYRSKMRQKLYHMQIGRHTDRDVLRLMVRDVDAIASLLGQADDKEPYLFGVNPSIADCTLWGFLDNVLYDGCDTPLHKLVRTKPNLIRYCERIRAKFFADIVANQQAVEIKPVYTAVI